MESSNYTEPFFWHTLPGEGRSSLSLCIWLGVPEMLEQVFWFRLTSASTE